VKGLKEEEAVQVHAVRHHRAVGDMNISFLNQKHENTRPILRRTKSQEMSSKEEAILQ